MAFGAVTILMDTLYQHFLQPTPRFTLRSKRKVASLYGNLCFSRNILEEDPEGGKYDDEAMKGLETLLRDASIELRFQIEHQLTLLYLGKAMKVRLHSAKNLLPILNRTIRHIETMDFASMLDILQKHFMLPVSGMPARIKKRVISFCTQYSFLFYEQDSDDEQEIGDEERKNMLCEAESLIRQELRASYLKKHMKQRIVARQKIRQILMLGIKLTSYIKKELLKVKNASDQSKNSQNTNTATLGFGGSEGNNSTVGDLSQHTSKSATKMVGCDDEFNMIMDKLNQPSFKREIVSIVGMGGIGKTTLVRRIYEDDSFISNYHCRAWVTISQEYNRIQVFQTLLYSLAPDVYENNEASDNELDVLVYRCLKGQKYLVVIDDIWSLDVWEDLIRYFQDDNTGSRILLTTQLTDLAENVGLRSNFCHNKRFLGSLESWNLFCNKMLPERINFYPKFEAIAREIVEKCKGLPLAITVTAGLLSNSKQNLNEWECIAKNVHTLSLDHSNQLCENILHLSYTFLPHHLKLCFLSFGCFPEDYKVSEDMIVDFWLSEGFLKAPEDIISEPKSLEDVARKSLQGLVSRNLVLIYGERNDGLSKIYQMHDVLHELALREAEKENLLCFKEDYGIGLSCRINQPINSLGISQRLSIQAKICSYKSRVHSHFKFLRALFLHEFIDVNHIVLEIVGLVHLRCLKIAHSLSFHSLPLFMMWNLQKLELENYSSCEPLYIWGLPQLRNLFVKSTVTLVPPRSVHHNLKTIRFLDYGSCTQELFQRIPNLRTLGFKTDYNIHPKCKASNWFESLAYLSKLEELVVDDVLLHWEFRTIHSLGILSLDNFLLNLKKLKLQATRLKWKDIDVVGTLSKLEELKLVNCAVSGRKWEPKDGGFYGLKFLAILGCDLQCWEATNDHFPVLDFLVLRCPNLKNIPSGFAKVDTLKSIKLYGCPRSVILSAERIRKVQRVYGNYTFAVDILSLEEVWSFY